MIDNNICLAQFYGKSQNYTKISRTLYNKYNVKRGLRNEDHTGVLVGLTRIADVIGYTRDDTGNKINCNGVLYYRGIDINELVTNDIYQKYLYEQASFLLLFGYLPTTKELDDFCSILQKNYELPHEFLEMNLLRLPGKHLMNKLQHALLTLYNYDSDPDNTEVYPTLQKGLNIMGKLPSIAVYAYMSKMHYYHRKSLIIHYPRADYSTAENILSILRPQSTFTPQESRLLDLLLFLHADHGGGTNSTFTNVVVSSTNTDLYSSMAASIGALKGSRHGGANIKVSLMMEKIIETLGLHASEKEIKKIIEKIINHEFFDNQGLIYGFGHAVYTLTDPRAELIKMYCQQLSKERTEVKELFDFYVRFEKLAKSFLSEKNQTAVCTNVDFYSGFAYQLLGIPRDLYTPLFVISRFVGWLAHNIEHKLYDNRIVRPATKYVGNTESYIPWEER
ncbi:citrate synthase [uncultured Megasphaera sp.]|uniref:citrate synthase n=1 Tax=uncultured Megasphaera sp. TaxID=165188 RepID=UPI00259B775A|nr:citrate synthase [uncultured Megasphaera sp.]